MFKSFISSAALTALLTLMPIQKAEANWWYQPAKVNKVEKRCRAYVKEQLSNHPRPLVRRFSGLLTPRIVDLIKDRNAGKMSEGATQIFIKNNLQSRFRVSEKTASWISQEASKQIESARSQTDCAQIK